MLSLNNEFADFDSRIKLTKSRKAQLIDSRNAVRDKIKSYYRNKLNVKVPLFQSQGSFRINTTLNPLAEQEIDIDDGVYLQNVNTEEEEWPKPSEIHENIIESLKNHTQNRSVSKDSCVRVVYENIYHIDLPVYIIMEDKAYLGVTDKNEWIHSDAKEFREWFYQNRQDEQTNRIIRYLKAWRDYNNKNYKSIELTILTVICHIHVNDNEGKTFLRTIDRIAEYLKCERALYKPVAPFENIWHGLSDEDIDNKIKTIEELKNDISSAVDSESLNRATIILREVFGERFPRKEKKKEEKIDEYTSGAKPWGT